MKEEVAPRREKWPEHLKDVPEDELTILAGDYCWLTEKNRPEDERDEFQRRRKAILADCERRGLEAAAANCRPSNGS